MKNENKKSKSSGNTEGGRRKQESHGLSRKAKMWIGFLLFCILAAGVVFFIRYAEKCLFMENLRLTVREVRLDCSAGYWHGRDPEDSMRKAEQFAKLARIVPGETNIFSFRLKELREKLLKEMPELYRLSAYRVLPDQVVFKIVERIPCADAGGGLFFDSTGRVLDRRFCADIEASLPQVREVSNPPQHYRRGDQVTSRNLLLALEFIEMASLNYPQIRIQNIVSVKIKDSDFLQVDLRYKNDPNPFKVRLPTKISKEKMCTEIPERLIPALEEGLRDKSRSRVLTLTFNNQVVVSPAPSH